MSEIGNAIRLISYLSGLPPEDREKEWVLTEKKKKRSKNANSYFWSLVNAIADKSGESDEDVHDEILSHHRYYFYGDDGDYEWKVFNGKPNKYGFVKEYDDNGKIDYYIDSGMVVRVLKETGDCFRDRDGNDVEIKGTIFWHIRGTHQMDSKQMSKVIDEAVSDAESYGIPTKTSVEIDNLLKEWEKAYG